MKSYVLYFISLIVFCSCLIRKTKEVSFDEIRPIVIPKDYDTSFVRGSEKIEIINEYWNWGSSEKSWTLTEDLIDTLLHTRRERTFYSDTSILSEMTIDHSNTDSRYIDLFYKKDINHKYKYLLDCNKKEIRTLKDSNKLTKYKASKKHILDFIETTYGTQNTEVVELDFDAVVNAVEFNRFLMDSSFSLDFDLILKDKKRIHLYRVFNDFITDSFYVLGVIVNKIKPVDIKYSEIKVLVNQVDSIDRVDQFMKVRIDSATNDLLLEVECWKDYVKTGKRKSESTKVVFHINIHTKEVKKISERIYESTIAH